MKFGYWMCWMITALAPIGMTHAARPLSGDVYAKAVVTAQCNAFIAQRDKPLVDVADYWLACHNSIPVGGVLELPPAIYWTKSTLFIVKRMTLRTIGQTGQPPCTHSNYANRCAVIRARQDFVGHQGVSGLVEIVPPTKDDPPPSGVTFDHMVFDGNRSARTNTVAAMKCASLQTRSGLNVLMYGDGHVFTHSMSMNALCGTGLGIRGDKADHKSTGVQITSSTFYKNGTHDKLNMWSDGLTLRDAVQARIEGNYFEDNTDVQLIVGGCFNCTIRNNTIVHNYAAAGGSFAALNLGRFTADVEAPASSGVFSGTQINGNLIDCGNNTNRNCGYGILVGTAPWNSPGYTTGYSNTVKGTVANNTVRHAQTPIQLTDCRNFVWQGNVTDGSSVLHYDYRAAGEGHIGIGQTWAYRSADAIPNSTH